MNVEKKQEMQPLADDELDVVTGGAKTTVEIDDKKMAYGGMLMEVEGEMVILENDGDKGYKCTVNGKEYSFSNAEIEEMLRQQLQG